MKFDKIAPLASSGGSSGGSSTHSKAEPQLQVTSPGTTVTLPQMIGLSAFDVENLMNRAGTGLSSHSKGATIHTYASIQTSNNKQDDSKTVNDINEIINDPQISPQSARIIAQSSNPQNENEIMDTLSSIDTNNPLLAPRIRGITSRGSSMQPIKPRFNAPLVLNTDTRQLPGETPVNHETDQTHQAANTVPQMETLELQMHGKGSRTQDSPLAGRIPQVMSSSVNTVVVPQIMGSTKTDKIMTDETTPSATNIPHATSSSINTVVIEQSMESQKPEKIITTETTTQTTPKKTSDEDESGRNCISCSFKCVMNCLK